MLRLDFAKRSFYSGGPAGITVPVTLSCGAETTALFAAIDTGAANCLFERSHGELLGLDIERRGFVCPLSLVLNVTRFAETCPCRQFNSPKFTVEPLGAASEEGEDAEYTQAK